MPLRFRCYTDPEGRDVIREWFEERDEGIQGDFAGIVEILRETNKALSNENLLKSLKKRAGSKCLALHEILIDRDNHHYRVLGFLENNIFTMLYAFYKNTNPLYTIPCQEALKRKKEVMSDQGRAKDCQFPP